MKIAAIVARYLLGLVFFVFGLNGFLHFIPMPLPSGVAGQFMGALFVSHYLVVVALLQVIPAILLFANRFVPLALTLLGPIVVNILLYHSLMAQNGLPMALVLVILWLLVAYSVRTSFRGLLQMTVPSKA